MEPLMTLKEAAERLNLPATTLRRVAETHGLLLEIGRYKRIDPATIPELIEKRRSQPKDRVITGVKGETNGSYKTLADQKQLQARQTANLLKKGSRSTSKKETAYVVPLALKG